MTGGGVDVYLQSFFNLGARLGLVFNTLNHYQLYSRLDGPQGLSGHGVENLTPTRV